MDKLLAALKKIWKPFVDPVVAAAKIPVNLVKGNFIHILQEPLVYLGVIIAAVNTAANHTALGYATAALTAMSRALVTPVTQAPDAG